MCLLYVAAARLGGGSMFDQCGNSMLLLQDLVEEACLISMVTVCHVQDLVEGACLINVVTNIRCC